MKIRNYIRFFYLFFTVMLPTSCIKREVVCSDGTVEYCNSNYILRRACNYDVKYDAYFDSKGTRLYFQKSFYQKEIKELIGEFIKEKDTVSFSYRFCVKMDSLISAQDTFNLSSMNKFNDLDTLSDILNPDDFIIFSLQYDASFPVLIEDLKNEHTYNSYLLHFKRRSFRIYTESGQLFYRKRVSMLRVKF